MSFEKNEALLVAYCSLLTETINDIDLYNQIIDKFALVGL